MTSVGIGRNEILKIMGEKNLSPSPSNKEEDKVIINNTIVLDGEEVYKESKTISKGDTELLGDEVISKPKRTRKTSKTKEA